MASTYSLLKIELQTTGENDTTWGEITNDNLEALEEAIIGSADVTFASANVTISFTDSNASQTARNIRLRCTGTTGGARNLVVPTMEKPYLIKNDCADTITVKTSAGTGVAVPAGKSMWVYVDGTNVVDAIDQLAALAVTGNVTVGGTLGVTGAVNITSTTLSVNGSQVWTGANDGSGSGLDADMLDGVQGADYARISTGNAFSASGNNFVDFISVRANGGPYYAFHNTASSTRSGRSQRT